MSDEIVERLISRTRPEDAVASFYTYSSKGLRLVTVGEPGDAAVLVEAQGSLGPVALLRADGEQRAAEVLTRATPGERYVMAPWGLRNVVLDGGLASDPSRNLVFWMATPMLDLRLPPEFACKAEGTSVRIRQDRADVTSCVCIWQSSNFAEVQVSTAREFRRRGLGRVAVGTLGQELLRRGITPLYVTSTDNTASLALAGALGLEVAAEDEFAASVAFSD